MGCVFDDMSVTVGGAYLTAGSPSSVRGWSLCGLGIGGAGRCGIIVVDWLPGGLGAGRMGSKLPFIWGLIGELMP